MATFLSRPSTVPAATEVEMNSDDSNMKVVVRIRPENEAELRGSHQPVVKALDDHVLVFDPNSDNAPSFDVTPAQFRTKKPPFLTKKHKNMSFAFDRVFDETASQMEVFEHATRSIIDGVLNGINCSVFAYGATGAGKTFTMLGNPENPGVMFLTMMELYRRINELRDEKTCDIAVSYCEIYNETIKDLLVPSGPLHLREDSNKGLVVSGLSRHQPKSAEDILKMLEIGNLQRTQHPTDANATSSRSHAIFQVFVHQQARTAGLSAEVTQAKMSLIDLAGSERATVTTNSGERLREGANINKSLLALGNCINALADNKGKAIHVPYRNSKLTRLLKDSLGGNCRTVMIANISPSGLNYDDTYNTLKYADRAKQIKTRLVRNVVNVDFHVTKYRAIVQDLQNEIAELKDKLERKTPKRQSFDVTEAARLQGLIQGVYGERLRLRKRMAELDASERETLLKVCRKERDIGRIAAISCNEDKKAKLSLRVEALRQHVIDIQREKQTVNEYLYSNNETIGRIQAEVNATSTGKCGSLALQQLLESVTEAKKFETENAHKWKQIKHLLKYVKNQEKEITKTERMLTISLEVVRQQHTMLRACNGVTPNLRQSYEALIRMAEGDKEVAWADENAPDADVNLMDVSTSTFTHTQQTLFDSFIIHASPMQRCGPSGVCPPVAASPNVVPSSLGILNSSAFQVVDPISAPQHTPAANTPRFMGTGPAVHTPVVATPLAPPHSRQPVENTTPSSRLPTSKSSIFSIPGSLRSKFTRSRSPAIAHNSSGSNNVTTHATPKGIVSSSSRFQNGKTLPGNAPERTSPPTTSATSANKPLSVTPHRSAFTTKLPDSKNNSPKVSPDSSHIKSGNDINYVRLYKLTSAERNGGGRPLLGTACTRAPAITVECDGTPGQNSSVHDLWKKPTPRKNGMLASAPHLNGSKASLFKIPNKPRVPTPIDNYSSSSASCVTYSTRLNTMLNSKRRQDMPAAISTSMHNTAQLRNDGNRLHTTTSTDRTKHHSAAQPYSLPSQFTTTTTKTADHPTPRNSTSDSSCSKSTSTLVSAHPPSSSSSYSDRLNLAKTGNVPRVPGTSNRLSRSPPSVPSTPTSSNNNFCTFEDNFISPHIQQKRTNGNSGLRLGNQAPPPQPPPATTLLCRPQSSVLGAHVAGTPTTTSPQKSSPSSRSLSIGLASISSAFKRIGIGHSATRPVSTAQVSPSAATSYHSAHSPRYPSSSSCEALQKSHGSLMTSNVNTKTQGAFSKTRPMSEVIPHHGLHTQNLRMDESRGQSSPLPFEQHHQHDDLNTTFTVQSEVRASVSHRDGVTQSRAGGRNNDGSGVMSHRVPVGQSGGNPLVTLHVNTVIQERQGAPNVPTASTTSRNGLTCTHSGIPTSKHLQRHHAQKQEVEQEHPRKLPSYLQMTKSAASKRVLRMNNKENKNQQHGKTSFTGRLKARRFQDVANKSCNGGVTISAPQTQLVW